MGDVAPRLARLLADLARPQAFPGEHHTVEVVQTHASVVFLVDDEVWKVKKPVNLGFLDYGTLERRAEFCALEVALNRRLAPEVYLGVDPITAGADGRLRIGGDGPAVEHAVHMRRLPDDATLRAAVQGGGLAPQDLVPVARRLAAFHATAERPPEAAHAASFEVVARLARDNLAAMDGAAGLLPTAAVARLADLTEAALAEHHDAIEDRAGSAACAFHGDLRLEHVFRFPERTAPGDVVVLDGIEFDPMLRFGDPVADIAFLAMDLQAYGAWTHARALTDAWLDATGDPGAAALLPLYISYRSAVRAKVALLQHGESEIPASARAEALVRARRHLRLALGALLPARERPRLVVTTGLPGSGKSTVARGVAAMLPLEVIRSDVVRKELSGLSPLARAGAAPDAGLYAPEMGRRTYDACLERARHLLDADRAVMVDASFPTAAARETFRALARELGVPFHVLHCTAPDVELRRRLEARRGDASDADVAVLEAIRGRYELPFGPDVLQVQTTSPEAVVDAVASITRP